MFQLYHGKESYLSLRAARSAFQKFCEERPDFGKVVLDCEKVDAGEIIKICETVDMFSPGKNILLKRLYRNKQKEQLFERLKNFLSNEDESRNTILWEDQKIASNTKFFKFFGNQKAAFESAPLNKQSFMSWAAEEIKRDYPDIKADRATLYSLAEISNYEPERFMNSLKKISLSGEKIVTAQLIKDTAIDTYESDIWALIDSINGRNDYPPIEILENLFQNRVDPIYILAMIVRNTRSLLLCKSLRDEGYDSSAIAKELKIPPFTVPALVKAADDTSYERLFTLYDKLANLDYQMKTGEIDGKLGLTLLIAIM
ncbi:MAG: DNA polymerase III subunit delta [Candidatus Dojkabacteria bacterium]|nr:MAG: DNA polymerase III subunit delta [Candidatus Dojkabacteria bacterium]